MQSFLTDGNFIFGAFYYIFDGLLFVDAVGIRNLL
jgi:hypothetical protein